MNLEMLRREIGEESRDVFEQNALRPFFKVSGTANDDSLMIVKAGPFSGDRLFLYTSQREKKLLQWSFIHGGSICVTLWQTYYSSDLVIPKPMDGSGKRNYLIWDESPE